MGLKKLRTEKPLLRYRAILGGVLGAIYSCVEYLSRRNTESAVDFLPLVIKAIVVGACVSLSVTVFNLLLQEQFAKKAFLYHLGVKSLFYTAITTFWLLLLNGIWYAINGGIPLREELTLYIVNDMYVINLLTVFFIVTIIVTLAQINSLHRKRELWNFILGNYNTPQEVERIFCFIDLKGSTTIAEKLGHFQFAHFLKDYYSDITDAFRKTNARIYQYVGDEVIVSWSYARGYDNNNFLNCFFQMKDIFLRLRPKYEAEYGVCPDFKAGVHGGKVIVTWVGELKKEIVYVGDVVNTAARIQEQCKITGHDLLVSEELLQAAQLPEEISTEFVEEIALRGKEKSIRLYSVEHA